LYNCILLAWSMHYKIEGSDPVKGSFAYNPIYFSSLFLMPKNKGYS